MDVLRVPAKVHSERGHAIDQALFAVVMEAYLHGVSTRKVDDLVRALGADTGISKYEVSRICADLDEEVAAFRDRSLAETAFPYLFLDATHCKARVDRGRRPSPSTPTDRDPMTRVPDRVGRRTHRGP